MNTWEIILLLSIGFAVGATLIYLFAYRKLEKEKTNLEIEKVTLTTEKEGEQDKVKELKEDIRTKIEENATLTKVNTDLDKENATLKKDVEHLEKTEKTVSHISEQVGNKLQNKHQTALSNVVHPFTKQIERFNNEVEKLNAENNTYRGNISQQLKSFLEEGEKQRKDAKNIERALLGNIKIQGNWGEMVLGQLFEKQGWKQGIQYNLQNYYKGEKSKIPDATIHLSEDRSLIVDAKMSFGTFMDYMSQDTSQEKKEDAKKRFLQATQKHIKGLGGKNYTQIKELRFLSGVLMFIPYEPAFSLAVDDSKTFDLATENNIILVSPTTLLGIIRVVNDIRRGNQQTELNDKFLKESKLFLDKSKKFWDGVSKLREHLQKATEGFDETEKQLLIGGWSMSKRLENLKEIHEGTGLHEGKELKADEQENKALEVQGEEIKGEEIKGEEEVPKALESPEAEREEEKKASSDLFSSFDEPPPR